MDIRGAGTRTNFVTISIIGLCVQIAGTLILFFLFVVLTRHDKRSYLKYWTWSWALYAASLVTLLASFWLRLNWPYALYQFLELGAAGMITAAGMNYARGFQLERRHALWLIPAAAWSIAGAWAIADFSGLYAVHSLLMGIAFAYNAYVFFRSSWFRSNVGVRIVAFSCSLIALVGFHYAFIFAYAFGKNIAAIGYLQFSGFYDLLMQYVLALGMVVMGMRETQRRLADTHSKLEEAWEQLRYLAQTDPLTGVYNRHAFREICDRELGRTDRGETVHSLVLLDIDNLKQINDLAGHSMGDEVLRAVARGLTSMIRGEDCLVRWGGDEFLLLMRETAAAKATERMKLVSDCLSQQFVHSPAGKLYFGISYALSEVSSIDGLSQSIEAADREMCRCKVTSKRALRLV